MSSKEAGLQKLIMPGDVRSGQVIGLVEVAASLGEQVSLSKVAEELNADLQALLPVLNAAEMLGLLRNVEGKVSLTQEGVNFISRSRDKITDLKVQISRIEPFKTALSLASLQGEVSTRQVASALERANVRWHYDAERNDALIQSLLIHWSISGGLLAYDGRTGKFRRT